MKKLVVLVALSGAISLRLAAQDSEPTQVPGPTQTPDVITVPEQTDAPEPSQVPEPAQAPGPLGPREKALIQSAYDGKPAEVQALVAKGASVNVAGKEKRSHICRRISPWQGRGYQRERQQRPNRADVHVQTFL